MSNINRTTPKPLRTFKVVLGYGEAYEEIEVEADRVTFYAECTYFHQGEREVFLVPSKHVYYIQEVDDE